MFQLRNVFVFKVKRHNVANFLYDMFLNTRKTASIGAGIVNLGVGELS